MLLICIGQRIVKILEQLTWPSVIQQRPPSILALAQSSLNLFQELDSPFSLSKTYHKIVLVPPRALWRRRL
eukprot:7538259-Pyramimonas_sp.AAC.2